MFCHNPYFCMTNNYVTIICNLQKEVDTGTRMMGAERPEVLVMCKADCYEHVEPIDSYQFLKI